jgi:protein TonB
MQMPAFVAIVGGGASGGSARPLRLDAPPKKAAAPETPRVLDARPPRQSSMAPAPAPVVPEAAIEPETPAGVAEGVPEGAADAGVASAADGNGNGSGTGSGTAGAGSGSSGAGMSPGPYRLGNGIQPPRKIKDVSPIYPAGAVASRTLGTVMIEATVGADGKVHDAKVIHSIPLLDQAALDAVRQWEFAPSRLNGVPVAVIVTVLVQFAIH